MNLFSRVLLVASCFALSVSAISGQAKPESELKQEAEMKKLEAMVGTWKGTGWVMSQNGRQTSSITETFQYKLGGQIAVVDGLGTSRDPKTGVERTTHQAYGVFSYDRPTGKIKFRYYKAETGEEGETLIEVLDRSFTWGFDVNKTGSKVRFAMRINEKNNWYEIGEFSRDGGKTWMKFMEMELSKVSAESGNKAVSTSSQSRYYVFNYFPGTKWLSGRPLSEQPLRKHFAYMTDLEARRILLLGGPFKDDSGAFGIIEAADIETATRIIKNDPAVMEEIVRFEVREWTSAVAGCVSRGSD